MTANGIAIIILAACSGYAFISNSYYFKYRTARKSGQHLYLMAVSWGLCFTFITCFLAYLLKEAAYPGSHILKSWNTTTASELLHLIAGLALVTVCAIVLVNLRHDKASALYDAFNFDDLSRTMMVSIAEEKPMQVTLDNRKAYVGFVIDTVEPNQDASFLTLFPLYSGYRDESSLELKLSNDYFTTSSFEDIGTNNPDDFGIVIPRSKIVTCHIFNTDLHKAISKQRKELLAASIE